ncbi:MAG: hypothetical protein OXE95_08135 [Chloroflexi bacterium]|nr:hypothetical protein [Chloroflexota bacterium]MCY4247526.1 hypothetical protein [Chloroflexota bacterium]
MADETVSPETQTERSPVPKPPDSIHALPEDQREELLQYFRQVIHVEQTTGLMPPPSMLAAYTPEVQKIIVDEFAQHGQHRRAAEVKVVDASIQRERRGMWLGFALAMTLILCGTAVILAGYSAEGLGVIGSTAGALAVAYIVDRRSRED